MKKASILIVEDEGIVLMDIENKLKSLGFSVAGSAYSGEEALEKAMEHHPDLVLMDIKLRGEKDGIETAQQIRSYMDIPVIYLTAFGNEEMIERAKVTEPFGYILKPFNERELSIAITMALYKHRMEQKLRKNERWLEAALKCIGDAVVITDNAGNIKTMNTVAEGLMGRRVEKVIGRDLADMFEIIDEKKGVSAENILGRAIESGINIGPEKHVLVAKDRTKRPIEASSIPIRDDDGKVSGGVMFFRDISKETSVEDKIKSYALNLESVADKKIKSLERSEENYRNIVENSRDGIGRTNFADGKIVSVNPAYCRLTEYEPEELIGKTTLSIGIWVNPEKREEMAAVLKKKGTIRDFEFDIRTKSGIIKTVNFTGWVICDDEGVPVETEGIYRDITE